MEPFFFFFFLLASPFLLMWWMVVMRNRMRNLPRAPEREEEAPFEPAYTDVVKRVDGLSYSRSFDVNEELLTATRQGGERDAVKDLQGRR
jgi:hypothetical protein